MRTTKKTLSRLVQVTAPLNVPPTKQASTKKPLTVAQRNARIKQLEKELAESKALITANELFFTEQLSAQETTIIDKHSGKILLKIEDLQAFCLNRQLGVLFEYYSHNFVDIPYYILQMVECTVDSKNNDIDFRNTVGLSKELIKTLSILYDIHKASQLPNQ